MSCSCAITYLLSQGHAGESWNCCVSPNGAYVASCGSDKVIRLYEKTNEPLVLEDEAEQENELVTGETTAVLGQKQQVLPSRKTVSSEKAVSGNDKIRNLDRSIYFVQRNIYFILFFRLN